MLWPVIAILVALCSVALHYWWRAKSDRVQKELRREIANLQQDQLQAAAEVRMQQATLFDSMVEGLLILDEFGRIELANRAFINLFGITSDLRSRTILEALRLHELADLLKIIASEKQTVTREIRLSRPVERWLEINGAPILSDTGRSQGTILVFHDLTRLKQLENTRKDFVANVSHELRTPLSLIKGYVETLLDGAKDNPEVATRFLQTIERNAERLTFLIEDLLVISELESGRVQLDLETIALAPVVDKVLGDMRIRSAERGVSLVREMNKITVRADPDRLEQVISNLVENAVKYGRENGRVVVGARAASEATDTVEVFVQDDGPGIPGPALERLFERFYRVDKARSREQGGTGLGLSIVKHIVQSHGGKVWATSSIGQGTTFFFTLPLGSPAAADESV